MAKKTLKESKERLKRLKESAEKHFGKGSILLLGETEPPVTDVIKTDIFSLDLALGIGGLPRGRMVEIYGPESTGKTTLALYAVAEAQRRGEVVAFVDAEHALDLKLARTLGVKTEELLLSQPDCGEQALEMVEHLARTGEVGVIVVDSVTALTPKAELQGDMGDSHMGVQARLMSQACRKLVAAIAKTNTLLIWINQIRMKIGVVFGNPETTTGGNALKFYSTLRLEVRRGPVLKNGDEAIGHTMRVTVAKNKMAPPFKKVQFPLLYGQGVDKVGDIFDLAVKLNIIKKSGSWYSYGDDRLGQGRDRSVDKVAESQKILDNLGDQVREAAKADQDL